MNQQKNKLSKDWWLTQKWGELKLDPNQQMPDEWSEGSGIKLRFLCDCGRNTTAPIYILKSYKSCSRCTFKSKEYWLQQKWGKISLNPNQELPDEWGPSSGKKFKFLCGCGRNTEAVFYKIPNTCAKCSYKSKEYWLTQIFGELKLDPNQELPEEWGPQSNIRMNFLCSCGKTTKTTFQNAGPHHSVTCGKCTAKSKEWWLGQRWGKLILDPTQKLSEEIAPRISLKLWFLCDCGKKARMLLANVTKGYSKSCDKCTAQPKEYWLTQKWGKIKLDPNQELPINWPPWYEDSFKFICDCGGVSTHLFGTVNAGYTKSCGCLKIGQNEFSPETEIRNFVHTLAPDTYPTAYPIPNSRKSYDVYVPSKKLAIEFHGLIWHSEKFIPPKKDFDKFMLAKLNGDKLIQIFEDEWRDKRSIMETLLLSEFDLLHSKRIKPDFIVEFTTSENTRAFLNQHHYLGAASGCLTVVAKHKDEIVGVWVFMKRSNTEVIWHRACWNHNYKTWNPHEKALTIAAPLLKKMGFTRVVTFSDNRFHTGSLYEKLGFIFEEELGSEYGYTDGRKRVSKYSLRVKAGTNEKSAAEAKGWYRIWDSGKKRYSLSL